MKVTKPSIRLVLLGGENKEGKHRLMVEISYYGRIRIPTGLLLKDNEFSMKRQSVKNKADDAIAQRVLKKCIDASERLIAVGEPFTAKDIRDYVSAKPIEKSKSLWEHCNDMMDKSSFRDSSRVKYLDAFRSYSKHLFGEYEKYNDITIRMATMESGKAWAKSMKDNGLSNETIKGRVYNVRNVMQYLSDVGIFDSNPWGRWKYLKEYKPEESKIESCPFSQIKMIESYIDYQLGWEYASPVYVPSNMVMGSEIGNKSAVPFYMEELGEREKDTDRCDSKLFAACVFYLGFAFQGLALADMAYIKAEGIQKKKGSDGHTYFYYSNRRRKTNVPFEISIRSNTFAARLMMMFIETSYKRDGYLFPILSPARGKSQYKNARFFIDRKLKELFSDFDRAFDTDIALKDVVGYVPMKGMSYYSCRHAFASAFIQKGGDVFALGDLMARSPDGLRRYVARLKGCEDVANKKDIIGL